MPFPGIGRGPNRNFPTDRVSRQNLTRKGQIATVMSATAYLVDFDGPQDGTDIAFYSGFDVLTRTSVVICQRLNESYGWQIVSVVQVA